MKQIQFRDEKTILDDVCNRCHELDHRITPAMIHGYWDICYDDYVIENYLFCRTYSIPKIAIENIQIVNRKVWDAYIDHVSKHLADESSDPNQHHTCNSKENNKMFKKLSDTEYENTVAAIADEYEDKKRDAKAEYDEKLAKAANEHDKAIIRENADMWGYDLYARYNALHELGFAEDLSIELLKLYISSKK